MEIVLLVIILILLGIMFLSRSKGSTCSANTTKMYIDEPPRVVNTESQVNGLVDNINKEIVLVDRKVNNDDLTAPVNRYPTNYYPQPPLVYVTNFPTRGLPDSYSYLGNMYREFDNKVMKLYGRRRYDDIWDYYAVMNSSDQLHTKINIETKHNQQLFDGDEVNVSMLGDGNFKVFLHKKDEFGYSPYLF